MLTINFAWIGLFILISVLFFLIHNIFGLNLFSKHDNKVIEKFLNKYPNVAPDFMIKGLREQNIENNQEIWEKDKQIKDILQRLEALEKRLYNG